MLSKLAAQRAIEQRNAQKFERRLPSLEDELWGLSK